MIIGKYDEMKAVVNDKKDLFLRFYDNLEQALITFMLLEPSPTLAKRAVRSAASINKIQQKVNLPKKKKEKEAAK